MRWETMNATEREQHFLLEVWVCGPLWLPNWETRTLHCARNTSCVCVLCVMCRVRVEARDVMHATGQSSESECESVARSENNICHFI